MIISGGQSIAERSGMWNRVTMPGMKRFLQQIEGNPLADRGFFVGSPCAGKDLRSVSAALQAANSKCRGDRCDELRKSWVTHEFGMQCGNAYVKKQEDQKCSACDR